MEAEASVPFEIGLVGECRSHIKGYRGAWFRCKLLEIRTRRGEPWCRLKYLDYEDRDYWTKLWQMDPRGSKFHNERQIMLRPQYPALLENPALGPGDMVDWNALGCLWECQITKVLNERDMEVACPDPPYGQGGTFTVAKELLRLSLEWCPESGWQVAPCEAHKVRFYKRKRVAHPLRLALPERQVIGNTEQNS